jgi:hypothetical protein
MKVDLEGDREPSRQVASPFSLVLVCGLSSLIGDLISSYVPCGDLLHSNDGIRSETSVLSEKDPVGSTVAGHLEASSEVHQ